MAVFRTPHAAGLLLVATLLVPGTPAVAAEGVGEELGYRLFGDARKNKPLLLQNSRPTAVEVFDDARGVFMTIERFSDLEVPCRGKERLLKLRFRDSFRETVPFQVRIACGRELQFISPALMATPRATPKAEAAPEPVAAAAGPDADAPAGQADAGQPSGPMPADTPAEVSAEAPVDVPAETPAVAPEEVPAQAPAAATDAVPDA